MKIPCYCEVEFLKEFGTNIPIPKPFENNDDYPVWCNYKNLFFKNANLILDNFEKLKNEAKAIFSTDKDCNKNFIFLLAKQVGDGVIKKEEKQIDNIDFETINPHTVFFLSDAAKCKELEEDYGMLFISNKTKNKNAEILFGFEQSTISITKNGKYSDYTFIDAFHHPCNAMIINDAYLLNEKDDTYNENLISLLDFLLPANLKKEKFQFQLLILSGDNKTNIDVRSRYSFIEKEIDKLRTYEIELKIITKKAHHNRDILTNYLRISVGNKFTLFKKEKATINDDLTIHSFIKNCNEMEVVTERKNEYRKIEKETQNIGSQIVVIPEIQAGKISNRLLNDFYIS